MTPPVADNGVRSVTESEHRQDQLGRFAEHASASVVALAAMAALCAAAWHEFAPPPGQFEKPQVLFESVMPDGSFPFLSRGREQFFEALIIMFVVGAILLAPLALRILRRLGSRGKLVLVVGCQVALGAIALLALRRRTLWGALDMLGWGTPRLAVGVVLALVLIGGRRVWAHSLRDRLPGRVRWLATGTLWALVIGAGAVYLAAIVETAGTSKDGDIGRMVNELLAPANSLHPLAGYAAQYTSLLGYLLVPFVRLGADPVTTTVAFITAGTLGVLALTLLIFRTVGCAWLSAAVSTLLVTALASTSQLTGEFTTDTRVLLFHQTVFTYHQVMPIRLLGPIVLGFLVVRGARRPSRRGARILGFVAAVVVANSVDFGGAAAIAATCGILVWAPPAPTLGCTLRSLLRTGADVALGAAAGIATVVAFIALVAHRLPDLATATLYVRSLGGGIIGLPLNHAWGFHVVVIGTFAVGVVLALAGWTSRPHDAPVGTDHPNETALRVALLYFSLFGIAMFFYYLNRPVMPTLVSGTFFSWGLCLMLLAVAALRAGAATMRTVFVGAFVLGVVCCAAFAQVLFPPSLSEEITRLSEGRAQGDSMVVIGTPDSAQARRIGAFLRGTQKPGRSVAIMTMWPNTLALRADVVSVTPFASLWPVSYPELDLLLQRLEERKYPDVYLSLGIPYPEVATALRDAGYREVRRRAGVALLRRPATTPPKH